MSAKWLIAAILFPIVMGAMVPVFGIKTRKAVRLYTGAVTILTSVFTWVLILTASGEACTLIEFTHVFVFQLQFDGLGRFFAGIVATLWPLTVLYAFEYLKDDPRQHAFFAFFTISFGVTLGITMSGDIFTLYCFYELLTLSTAPLIMHTDTKAAGRAARTYFLFSIGGAAVALLPVLYLTTGADARYSDTVNRVFYVLGFFGFGVKAAVCPLHRWLPKASVAPTPVTALLHAVAVVKSGVFAIIRLTWCSFDPELIAGTFAQLIPLCFIFATILYGSIKSVREPHWKRRLAYSTVSNLSYILFGVLLLTPAGLRGGLLHMAFHAEIKILAFFAAGAVMYVSGREYISELSGLGKRMPVTCACFTCAALALTGIPPFAGFISKWNLLTAAADAGTALAYIGAGAILTSALLTAIYMFTTVRRMYFPEQGAEDTALSEVHEAGWMMWVPMAILAVSTLVTGLFGGKIIDALDGIISGLSRWM
ncbi:MAG: proton-conducting membrane transporter [Lachnospiraceae bacterium]|nr:proton-conducting membrane transporter [Lachnospiraceae bacterium]